MSDSHSQNARRAEQAKQSTTGADMRLGKIVMVGFISLAVFAAGIGWSYAIMTGRREAINSGGVAAEPTQIGKPEIGIVDQVLFETDHRLEHWQAENTKRLGGYGWVDRTKGIAHIPIEAAMQQVVANPPDIAGEGVPPVTRIPAVVKGSAAIKGTGEVPAPAPMPTERPAVPSQLPANAKAGGAQ